MSSTNGNKPPDDDGPPAPWELENLRLELEAVRRSGLRIPLRKRPGSYCPWCGANTGGGPCRRHAQVESDYQQRAEDV